MPVAVVCKEEQACDSQKQNAAQPFTRNGAAVKRTSRKNSPLLSLTTVAVSPAALDPLPEVYTEMGAYRDITHLSMPS